MYTLYNLFKFVHVVAAIVWVGGVVAVGFLNVRLARTQDRSALAAVGTQSRDFGTAVVGPATGVTLIAGIVMIAVGDLGFPLWIIWGFIAILVSGALGGTVLRRTAMALGEQAAAGAGAADLTALQRRVTVWNTVNTVVLLSAVWAMVFKPTV